MLPEKVGAQLEAGLRRELADVEGLPYFRRFRLLHGENAGQALQRDALDLHFACRRAYFGQRLARPARLDPAAVDEHVLAVNAQWRDDLVACTVVAHLVVEQHGELRTIDAAHRHTLILHLRSGGTL